MKSGFLPILALASTAFLATPAAFGADIDVARYINVNTTWTADNTYFISGYTFVLAPATLTIQPGTVIKARQKGGSGEAAALVITAGAKIMADGTAAQPIIFTSELDDLAGNLGPDDSNLWGGLVILGNASINSRANSAVVAAPVTDQIEGFSVTGLEVGYITFGGTNDADNSGVVRYVSIRHGGELLSTANEINGLTLGGVGNGTIIEYVEVFSNKDDGVELFGGTVDLRYIVTAFGKDDGFDFDSGWRGRGQFWFTIGATSTTESQDKGGEWDGATAPLTATPAGSTQLYNLTFVGNGASSVANVAVNIRDNPTVKVYNSVFTEYAQMMILENDSVVTGAGNQVATTANIDFANNVWWSHIGANNNAVAFVDAVLGPLNAAFAQAFFTTASFDNVIADPLLRGISRTTAGTLDPRPAANSPLLTGPFATVPADGWYQQTNYKGAFAPGVATWMDGWTKLSTEGYLANVTAGSNQDFANISTRANVGTGDNVAIAGFIVNGPDPKRVLIRLVGKPLESAPYSLGGVLQDPSIELLSGQTVIAANDDWQTNANWSEIQTVSVNLALGLYPINAKDAVLLVTLEPGAYTVIGRGVSSTTGLAIIEVYAAD